MECSGVLTQEEIMSQAKREMEEQEEYTHTTRVLAQMFLLLKDNKAMSISELHELAKYKLAMRDEAQADAEELQRKMEKDD
jgi:hypothetical protein